MEIDSVDVDAVSNAGVTPLMMAIESGNIQLVAEALNSNLNPFLKDALGRQALDYAQAFRDVMGHDMRELIQRAMDQWLSQTDVSDRIGSQQEFSAHFTQFRSQDEQ